MTMMMTHPIVPTFDKSFSPRHRGLHKNKQQKKKNQQFPWSVKKTFIFLKNLKPTPKEAWHYCKEPLTHTPMELKNK